MISQKDIRNRIYQTVEERIEAGVIVRVAWLTQEVLSTVPEVENEAKDFYASCAADYVSKTAKAAIQKYDGGLAGDEQMILDGFEHLQKAYPFVRDGERVLVPLDQCTDDELLSRMDEFRSMIDGLRGHIKEMEDYVSSRSGSRHA